MNAFMPTSLSSSPGGNSWPVAGSLWGSSAMSPPSFHSDKYNTLPAGSAALYRGMFTAASRSPLSARASSLRFQQQSQLTEARLTH